MSLLTVVQDAADRIGVSRPATVIANANLDARQLFQFTKEELQVLADGYAWQQLVKEGEITLATADQDYALPADFHRMIPDTTYDRENKRQVRLPMTGAEWAWLKGWDVITSLNRRARIIGNLLTFYEPITAGDNGKKIHFEYISKNKAYSPGSPDVPRETYQADADVSYLPEHVITLGVVWRYKQHKGLEFQVDAMKYERERRRYEGFNRTTSSLSMGGGTDPQNVLGSVIPDRSYG